MIEERSSEEQLFYTHDEIAQPSGQNLYMRFKEAGIDWQKLSEPFRGAFSEGMGRPMDPAVYLKIFLVAYLENITCDTDLAERISDSIAIRKFYGRRLERVQFLSGGCASHKAWYNNVLAPAIESLSVFARAVPYFPVRSDRQDEPRDRSLATAIHDMGSRVFPEGRNHEHKIALRRQPVLRHYVSGPSATFRRVRTSRGCTRGGGPRIWIC